MAKATDDAETVVPDWRVPQEFDAASSFAVRSKLEALVKRDLLGPWDGETEQFKPRAAGPLERYLVGRIGPRHDLHRSLDGADQIPDTELADDNDPTDAELTDKLTLQAGRLWPSSMGMSFTVAGDTDVLSVTASWGRYSKTETLNDAGNPVTTWSREPIREPWELRLDGARSQRKTLHGDDDTGVHLRAEIRSLTAPDGSLRRFVELSLVNGQREPLVNKDAAWLFQPEIIVTALDGARSVFLPVDDPMEDVRAYDGDPEERHLRLLYRDVLKYADGRNVAVHADVHTTGDAATAAETLLSRRSQVSLPRPSAAPGG